METLESKSWCNMGITVERNYHVKDDTIIWGGGAEKKVFSEYEYNTKGRKGAHSRTEKYRECLTIRRG